MHIYINTEIHTFIPRQTVPYFSITIVLNKLHLFDKTISLNFFVLRKVDVPRADACLIFIMHDQNQSIVQNNQYIYSTVMVSILL